MRRQSILLVDDEAIVRNSVSEWLREDAYDIECAGDGFEAIERVDRRRFDAAVIDLKMPGMDGIELMKRVRARSPRTRIIIITAYSTPENEADAVRNGADNYLAKPFSPEKLESLIDELSELEESPTEPAPQAVATATEEVMQPLTAVEKQCIWSKAGVVSYRTCIENFKCESCEFAQSVMDQETTAGVPALKKEIVDKMMQKEGVERLCRYMLSGHVSHRLCVKLYQCGRCAFNEYMAEKIDREADLLLSTLKRKRERRTSE